MAKSNRKLVRGKVKSLLRKSKVKFTSSNWGLACAAAQAFQLPPPKANTKGACYDIFEAVLYNASLDGFTLPTKTKRAPRSTKKPVVEKLQPDPVREFYASFEWRKLRLEILKRDGRQCLCCGAKPEHGVYMHVDHIKPLRFNWELRLDPDNLQVLCEICNHGKGNWDATDWRTDGQV